MGLRGSVSSFASLRTVIGMGEEFQSEHPPRLTGEVVGTGPLERVEIRHGLKLARTLLAPGAEADASPLIRVAWSGARIKQRKRQTIWDGSIPD